MLGIKEQVIKMICDYCERGLTGAGFWRITRSAAYKLNDELERLLEGHSILEDYDISVEVKDCMVELDIMWMHKSGSYDRYIGTLALIEDEKTVEDVEKNDHIEITLSRGTGLFSWTASCKCDVVIDDKIYNTTIREYAMTKRGAIRLLKREVKDNAKRKRNLHTVKIEKHPVKK